MKNSSSSQKAGISSSEFVFKLCEDGETVINTIGKKNYYNSCKDGDWVVDSIVELETRLMMDGNQWVTEANTADYKAVDSSDLYSQWASTDVESVQLLDSADDRKKYVSVGEFLDGDNILQSGLNTNLPDQLPSNIGNPIFSAPNNDTLKLNLGYQSDA